MKKKGGLGKGLDSLFLDVRSETNSEKQTIKLSQIEPEAGQPRKTFEEDALSELTQSIEQHGVLQPIIVRPVGIDGYKIIAGERRYRAARRAGLAEIPAVVMDAGEQTAMEIALVENLQRSDLNIVEEAQGLHSLIERFELTQEQVAQRVGKSRPSITNALRLLALSDDVLSLLQDGYLSAGHGKVLLSLETADLQRMAADIIIAQGLSVRQTEVLCKRLQVGERPEKVQKPQAPIAVEAQLALQEVLGTEVKVTYKKGKGRIEVNFYSDDQLKQFANLLATQHS